MYIGVNLLAQTGEIGSNVQQCSVVEKNDFSHWNDILLAPANTVEKKIYAKVRPRWDVYIGVCWLQCTPV